MLDRRQFLGTAFAKALLPKSTFAQQDVLSAFTNYDTGQPFYTSKPSLVAVFMTAQQMYSSCGELFLYANAEVEEIQGGSRNIEKVMIMPPRVNQSHPSEDRNLGSARASDFKILTADIQTTLDVSRQIAGRPVFAFENGKITGHSQKAFFYSRKDGRNFEFDPASNPFANDLYEGLQRF